MPRLLVLSAALAVSGCLASLATAMAAGPTLTESINARVKELGAFAWTPKRPLTWKDFRGRTPRESPAAAETAYTLLHGVRCVGTAFEFRVVAAFRSEESWVRADLLQRPAEGARALRHEQTHFDLAEAHARRLRRYFSELVAPCRGSNDDLSDAADRFVRDEAAAQAQYDSETDHGRKPAEQSRWDEDVDSQLFSTSRFTAPGNGRTAGPL
jgi:hypothetical protein